MKKLKTCSGCNASQPLSEYHNNPSARDGKQTRCKECQREYSRLRSIKTRKKTIPLVPLKNEEFKEINKDYLISNKGRVYRKEHYRFGRFHGGRFLNPSTMTIGYKKVSIRGKQITVHRLVALAFLDNPNNYTDVNHIDFNRENNNVENLEWCSKKMNIIHSAKAGRMKAKLTPKEVLEIRSMESSHTYKEIAEKYNVTPENINFIMKRKTWVNI